MAFWNRRIRGRVELQRKRGKPPWPEHVFVWLEDSPERQLDLFGEILEAVAPGPVDRVVLGFRTTPEQERTLVQFGPPVPRARLRELLRALSSQNLQLYWGHEGPDSDLAVICELYDDHIEICVPDRRRESVQGVLVRYENNAA